MKGLYIDVPGAEDSIRRMDDCLGAPTHIALAEHGHHRITVSYHPLCWPSGPIHTCPDTEITSAASGWFLFRGRLGDLEGLTESFWGARSLAERLRVLRELEGGAYTILLLRRDERALVTDPFGLHPHYYADDRPFERIAPSPFFLKDDRRPDPVLLTTLERQGHLFGNLTAYRDILRLEPNALIEPAGISRVVDLRPGPSTTQTPVEALRRSLAAFGTAPSILPITGGLDSRLLLAAGRFDHGYTFGPAKTGDRPVARRFRRHFREYHEFSLLDLDYTDPVRETGMQLLDGVCARPFLELLAVYRMLHDRWGDGFFFDGYAGDVLQRGLYMTSGGVRGSIAKLFPGLTRRRFDAERLLLRRYPRLERSMRDRLVESYRKESRDWDTTEPRKVVLYELIYGRGARYILAGGTTLSGQFFAAVQPFLLPQVFDTLWRIDPLDAMTYGALRSIWQDVPRELADVRTYSGFKPSGNPDVARATMLLVKGLGRLSLMKRSISYEVERPKVRWRRTQRGA